MLLSRTRPRHLQLRKELGHGMDYMGASEGLPKPVCGGLLEGHSTRLLQLLMSVGTLAGGKPGGGSLGPARLGHSTAQQ